MGRYPPPNLGYAPADNSFGAFACPSGPPVIPFPLAGLSGSYTNYSGCTAQPQHCFVAEGNWSFSSTAVVKYGTGAWTSGINTMGFVLQMCPSAYSYDAGTGTWSLQFRSPYSDQAQSCAYVQFIDRANPSAGMVLNLDMGWESLFNCSNGFGEEFLLAGFALRGASQPVCPLRGVVPVAFLQTPVPVFPSNFIDPSESVYAALTPDGYTADYGLGIATQTACALNFTIVEHNATANLTRWEMYMGSPTDGVSGCLTFIRLGRHLAFAERWLGIHDMDPSCGPAPLCCWNWTVVWDAVDDGMQTKILFDYFPDGWSPVASSASPRVTAFSLAAAFVAVALLSVFVF